MTRNHHKMEKSKPEHCMARGGHIQNSMRAVYDALHSHFENEPPMRKLGATRASIGDSEPHRETSSEMRKAAGGRMFIKEAIKHKGALHKALGVPKGKKIPEAKLDKAEHSRSKLMRQRANLAVKMKKFHH